MSQCVAIYKIPKIINIYFIKISATLLTLKLKVSGVMIEKGVEILCHRVLSNRRCSLHYLNPHFRCFYDNNKNILLIDMKQAIPQ